MYSTTHDAKMDSARCSGPDEKIPPAPGINQIVGLAEFRQLTSWEKIRFNTLHLFHLKQVFLPV